MKLKSLLPSLASTLVLVCLNSSLAADVTFRESDKTFFLNNGIIDVRIEKSSGDVFSIKYQGVELLAQSSPGGALGGYWSSVGGARAGAKREALVRIDPAGNGGSRVEIACRFYNEPGHPEAPLDVEIRYSLARGESGLHTWLIWRHKPGYPAFGVAEARFAVKLNPDVFDYMTIDEQRRRIMPTGDDWDRGQPTNLKEARRMTTGIHKGHVEHKYDYSALIYEIPAFGWSSTTRRLGFWFVNPSFEYMAGGPTKAELTGHLDVNTGGTPTLLNMWLGSHYGGSSLVVGQDEDWTKVIGPFVIYCNSLPETQSVANTDAMHRALWKDALARAETESAAWPYDWVTHPDYPPAAHRATIAGRIVLRDPFEPHATMSNLWVGVTAPDYLPPARPGFGQRNRTNAPAGGSFTNAPGRGQGGFGRGGFPPHVDWQRDAKHYQYWTRAAADGQFTIPHVREGSYTLHAIADGVAGEFTLTNLNVTLGETKNLGTLEWKPLRYGRTLWQIGVPDRTAREYRHGDHFWQWGLYFDYPKEFPDDVQFTIGKSDWRRDWNYVQPPRIEGTDVPSVSEDDENSDAGPRIPAGGLRNVTSTTWSIHFPLTNAPQGRATLRLAFCGTHQGCNVSVRVNGSPIGETGTLPSTSAMQRDGIRAYWIEKPLAFDASLLKPGNNTIQLHSHAGSWNQGVMYDYVRLELDDTGN